MSLLSTAAAEEFAPLTTTDDDHKHHAVTNDRRRRNNFLSSFTQQKQSSPYNNDKNNSNNSASDIIIAGGCLTDYQHRNGKYQGYCTLLLDTTITTTAVDSVGRVSMHDDWDCSPRDSSAENNNDDSDNNVDDDGDDGNFVSFWGQQSSSSSSSSSLESHDQKRRQQQYATINSDTVAADNDPKNLETIVVVVRPIIPSWRTATNSFSISEDANNFGSWFQRELGLNDRDRSNDDDDDDDDDDENNDVDRDRLIPDKINDNNNNNGSNHINRSNDKQDESLFRRSWGFGRRRPRQTNSASFEEQQCDNHSSSHAATNDDNNNHREEYVLYSAPSVDDESTHDGAGNGNREHDGTTDNFGHAMPAPANHRSQSPTLNNSNVNNIFGNDRIRRREGILSLPIVRPFLRRSHQGFSDQNHDVISNDEVEEDDGSDDCNNAPSKEDRAAVIKSISDGITGTHNNDPILLNNSATALDNSKDQATNAINSPPNLLHRIFLTRFIQIPNGNNERALLRQLHDLLRKEDWSLATELLESKPMLARKWHSVQRLYGGKFDAEALPIHSACALCPPASFIQTLATIFPEGLLKKEKAFGRTPLHIACRSLADSSVISVLCEMGPRSVIERDSLKRVPLHYLIKNYNTFGGDEAEDDVADKDTDDESINESAANHNDDDNEVADGIAVLNLLVETNIDCIKVADHRGWIPLHVACSCSARQGMIRVMKMLIDWWPESVNVKTEKNSDVFACVEVAGKHHATKDKVVALLKEARHELASSECNDEGNEDCNEDAH